MRRMLALVMTLALVGCTARSLPPAAMPGEAPAATTLFGSRVPGSTAAAAGARASEVGYLTLSIRWPDPVPAGFHAAAIPTTTQAIALRVLSQGVPLSEPTILSREPGVPVASASLALEVANNLSVEIKAYRESLPNLATAVPIAQGTATGVNVDRSRNTPVAITLESLFVPTVTNLSTNLGAPGETVLLTGSNFGTGSIPVTVLFNQATASVVRHSETSLSVTVPADATTGHLVVSADGIKSTSVATFWVPSAIALSAPRASWDDSATSSRLVLYGGTLQLTATPTWALRATESAALYGTPPAVEWSNFFPAAGALSTNGLFTASLQNATTSVQARLASITSDPLVLGAVGVDGVRLDTPALTLNAMPETGDPDPGYLTTATLVATVATTAPYNHGVTWSTSDSSLVTVAGGVVRTVRGAPEGHAIITATSVDDPRCVATASITVTIYGDINLGVN